ncbi:prepilin peptidase [Microvirga aerophila]|nr:A24 family peptidase [Microvirga aerophila]
MSHSIALGILLLLMAYVAIIDIKFMIIPDPVNAAIFLTGMAASLALAVVNPLSALCASVLGGGFLVLIQGAFRAYRGYDGLGWGDVKFVAAAATWTGLEGVPLTLLIASVSALVYVGVRQTLDRRFNMHHRVPFGPFLALGATSIAGLQILFGRSVADIMEIWMLTPLFG